jgi:hypothetical protein
LLAKPGIPVNNLHLIILAEQKKKALRIIIQMWEIPLHEHAAQLY